MTRLILWRHGQTDWNAIDRVQGQADAALSELGLAQAAAAAPKLAALGPDVLASSDLRRAADTAAALAALTGLPVHYDERLRERCFGDWQGLTHPEIAARWPEAYARWRAGEAVGAAGVEDLDALAKRTGAALQELVAGAPQDATIVVATHGGAARHGAGALLGWPDELASTLGPLENCRWSELRYTSVRGWQLRGHNLG